MVSSKLIRFLHRLFSTLYHGQVALLILSVLFFPASYILRPCWYQLNYQQSATNPRLFYDTLRSNTESHSALVGTYGAAYKGDTLKNYHETIGDTTFFYNANRTLIRKQAVADVNALTVARHSAEEQKELLQWKKRTKAQILAQADSILADDPNAMVVITKGGYAASGNAIFVLNFTLSGTVHESWKNPSRIRRSDWKEHPAPWRYTIAQKPTVELSDAVGSDHITRLQFRVQSLGDVQKLPLSVIAAKLFSFLLFLLIVGATYQLAQLFRNMSRDRFFTSEQAHHLRQAGLLFISYGVLRVASEWIDLFVGMTYLETQGLVLAWSSSIRLTVPDNIVWIITGLTILSLASAFRYGLQLKQENELTI